MAIDYTDSSGWRTRDFTMDAEDAAQAALDAGATDAYGNKLGTRTRAEAGYDRSGFMRPELVKANVDAVWKQKVAAQTDQEARWAAMDATRRQNSLVPLDNSSPQALARSQRTNLAQVPGGTDFYNNLMNPDAMSRKRVADYHQQVFDQTGSLTGASQLGPVGSYDEDATSGTPKKAFPADNLEEGLTKDPRFQHLLIRSPDHAKQIYQAVTGRTLEGDEAAKLAERTAQDTFNRTNAQSDYKDMFEDPETGKLKKRIVKYDPIMQTNSVSYVDANDYEIQNYRQRFKHYTGMDRLKVVADRHKIDEQNRREALGLPDPNAAPPAANKAAHPTVTNANDDVAAFKAQGEQDWNRIAGASKYGAAPIYAVHNAGTAIAHGINRVAGAFGAATPPISDATGGNADYVHSLDDMLNIAGKDWYNTMPSWLGGKTNPNDRWQ